jgi:hypothetical protein
VAEWLKATVCKTVDVSLRWFESNLIHQSERDGIGRHSRLKICRLRGMGVQVPPLVPKVFHEK